MKPKRLIALIIFTILAVVLTSLYTTDAKHPDEVKLDDLLSKVTQKYTAFNNPCNLAATGQYADIALADLSIKKLKDSLTAAIGVVEAKELYKTDAVKGLMDGSLVLNIKENAITRYAAQHTSGDINFMVNNCRF